MGNSLRCCVACLLPCGALDMIRIVHLNGHVDEFSRPVCAQEIFTAHPGHVLSTPSSPDCGGATRRILIISPESELKRGGFYFLIPASTVPDMKKSKRKNKSQNNNDNNEPKEKVEIKKRRCRRVGVWRPCLDSISEDPIT